MGKSRVHWLCFPLLKLISNFRRCPLSKRSLIIATVCVVYLFFVVSQVGYSQPHRGRRIDKDNSRHIRGLYNLESNGAVPDSADLQTGFVVPTRSNVVYITLKSKRLKPAHIRGTIRPKLRRKVRRNKTSNPYFTQNKLGTLERDAGQIKQNFALQTSWKETRDVDFISVDILFQQSNKDADADSQISAIRIYSQKAPPWFSEQDVKTMRFLADAKVLRMREVSHGDSPSLLIFEGETSVLPVSQKHTHRRNHACGGQCGVVQSPVDNTEVFAFHLDRLLGLNRTLPTVSRKFSFLHDGQSCPVVSWDASLYPESLAGGWPTVRLTWGEYQSSLKQRCWHKNIIPKPDSGCSTIHHYEWSKLALFDFLLQIHNRLDRSCCGFRPRREYVCVELGLHSECGNQDHVQLANVIHRGHDPRHLVFTNNEGFFDRNEDNLDFRLLEGIKESMWIYEHTLQRHFSHFIHLLINKSVSQSAGETAQKLWFGIDTCVSSRSRDPQQNWTSTLPEQAVSVLRSRKLREKLLQSLFLDQTYWESQGGRQGIDKLIDVIERRAEVLLTYITAHGIKVITMNV